MKEKPTAGRTGVPETPAGEIEIAVFRNEDAPGIVRLFREVYGDGYPIATYYDPDQLIAENASGNVISYVARTVAGDVVGHNALVLMDSASRLYENAAGAVLSAYRSRGIFLPLFKYTLDDAPKRFHVEGIIGEPVCSHTHVQKMCLQLGFKESGLEVALMPAAAYGAGPNALGRVSVVLGYFINKPRLQTVWVPPVYREAIAFLYADLELERTFVTANGGMPDAENSRGSMRVFESAQVARITMERIGSDFDAFVGGLEREALEKGTVIFQIWLPLDSPYTATATEILREHGHFLGGVMPCRPHGDGMLLQKVRQEPDWDRIALYSERAKSIGEMIKRDWETVRARV